MKTISARNVSEALLLGLNDLKAVGVDRDSRNGPVTLFSEPVTTVYRQPKERVLFYPERDANPFFHLMESLWMLAGRNDVEWISRFSSNIASYSDDGVTFHGAYGYRWRQQFDGIDQIATIAQLLKQNPDDRRTVMQMWSAELDLGKAGKDFPCNLTVTFRINPYGSLDMTVFNRSNDMIWGAYGANAVHFSMLQEVMAAWVGVPVGRYWQISTNFHGYHATLEKHKSLLDLSPGFDLYSLGEVMPYPVVNVPIENWFQDLFMFMEEGPVIGFQDPWFKKVVTPMWQSWMWWKQKNMKHALEDANSIVATDWRRACVEWLERRA
jgi:hypothetical protein